MDKTLRHAIETEDTVLAMTEYDNGAFGTIYFSTAEAGPRRMEIVGTKGKIRLAQDGTLEFSVSRTTWSTTSRRIRACMLRRTWGSLKWRWKQETAIMPTYTRTYTRRSSRGRR